ncbi:MAG: CbiX/SirB N-terminal domain-containing protein [Candidatus Omnitrophica bacterium]|nr:CbiX/SirB N-terminal domain-containing protein [Candidatus Omnitrophota bacterium]
MTLEGKTAVVLIGHGAPATDCPPQLVGELMGLEWRGGNHSAGGEGAEELQKRAAALDAKIRDWPRHPGNDPYKAGLERLAAELRRLLPAELFAVGYNEFCRPSVPEAVEQVIRQVAARVFVIPSMLTPGGLHSEVDIPRSLDEVRARHPAVSIEYVWPFDVAEVAGLLASHLRRVSGGS